MGGSQRDTIGRGRVDEMMQPAREKPPARIFAENGTQVRGRELTNFSSSFLRLTPIFANIPFHARPGAPARNPRAEKRRVKRTSVVLFLSR